MENLTQEELSEDEEELCKLFIEADEDGKKLILDTLTCFCIWRRAFF